MPILIGYASEKIRKICEESRAARKALPQATAALLPQRLGELAAFPCLSSIPFLEPPLKFHRLRENLSGQFAVWICKKYRIVFQPAGEFVRNPDGIADLTTVTAVEITAVEDYHNG